MVTAICHIASFLPGINDGLLLCAWFVVWNCQNKQWHWANLITYYQPLSSQGAYFFFVVWKIKKTEKYELVLWDMPEIGGMWHFRNIIKLRDMAMGITGVLSSHAIATIGISSYAIILHVSHINMLEPKTIDRLAVCINNKSWITLLLRQSVKTL